MRFKDLYPGAQQYMFWAQNIEVYPVPQKWDISVVPAKFGLGKQNWSYFQYLKNGICPGVQQNLFGEAKYRGVSIIKKGGLFLMMGTKF